MPVNTPTFPKQNRNRGNWSGVPDSNRRTTALQAAPLDRSGNSTQESIPPNQGQTTLPK
jgi:hypothetical protein